jgi:V-type H+-transporting ATPase subunit a
MTTITFPFLFGVMFGDIGHGSLLLLTGIFLVMFADKLKEKGGSTMKAVLELRYLFLLMGIFSTFCGFIYNDFLSIPLNLWGGSCYNFKTGKKLYSECVYPIGVDPVWYISK